MERTIQPDEERRRRRLRLTRSLARAEGQIRGVARMIEEDRYCVDVLNQVAAVQQALRRVARELLSDHMTHCVHEAFVSGDAEEKQRVTEEVAALMFKYGR